MQITYYDIDKLKPYKNNPRVNEQSIKTVAESIKQFGFKVPVIIDKDFNVITGHTRLKASELLNIEKIPCIMANDLTEEQVKAFRLADNKVSEIAEWDFEKLDAELSELTTEEMELLGFIKNEEIINWSEIDDLDEENYDEPEHKAFECPLCHHIDREIHFKKLTGAPEEE